MPERTLLYIDDCALEPVCADWVAGRFTCRTWTAPGSPRLATLMQALLTRQLKTCQYHPSRGEGQAPDPLSFAAYICDWHCEQGRTGLHRHTLTLAMSGSPWRDDDTPVEDQAALWALLMPARASEKD